MGAEGISIVRRGTEKAFGPVPVMLLYIYNMKEGPLQIGGRTRINLNEELISAGFAISYLQAYVQGAQARRNETATDVFFSSCDSPDAIYLRTPEMQRKFKTLKNEMAMHYACKNFKPKTVLQFEVGFRCAVFAENQWWRAEVTCKNLFSLCGIYLLDDGRLPTIHARSIYPLDPKFNEYPRLTMRCCLDGVQPLNTDGWDDSVKDL